MKPLRPAVLAGTALILGALLGAPAAARAGDRLWFDANWRFHYGDAPGAEQPGFDDAAWRGVNLPHDWGVEGAFDPHSPGDGGGDGHLPTGLGWYRRQFDAPAAWSGRRVLVEFEGAYENAEVWING
ncbi:MAG TPA: hypothetical protein VMF63_06900, partial [Opitutaceae bacterium]|nr:hypothetical protein [Opitutaceae bacterium]